MENISLNFFFIGFHTKSLLGGWALAYHMKSIFEIYIFIFIWIILIINLIYLFILKLNNY